MKGLLFAVVAAASAFFVAIGGDQSSAAPQPRTINHTVYSSRSEVFVEWRR